MLTYWSRSTQPLNLAATSVSAPTGCVLIAHQQPPNCWPKLLAYSPIPLDLTISLLTHGLAFQ